MVKNQQRSISNAWPVWHLPQVRNVGRFWLDDRNFDVTYRNEGIVALHLYEYRASMRMETAGFASQEFEIEAGDLTITRPNTKTRYALEHPGTHWCLHVASPEQVVTESDTVQLPAFLRFGSQRDAVVLRLGRIMQWTQFGQSSKTNGAGASAIAQELLLWLAEQSSEEERNSVAREAYSRADQTVAHTLEIIERSLSENLSAAQIAWRAGFSQNYLARLFKNRYGVTIPQYRTKRRIELAEMLLSTSDLPVKAIAARLGFHDAHHFNKQFREHTGRSPSGARNVSTPSKKQ